MTAFNESALRDLYISKGLSVRVIANQYSCSQQKVNYWLAKYGIPKRTISEAIYLERNPDGDPFKFKHPVTEKEWFLFGLGVGLYWGEGTKRSPDSIRLGNTDPDLVMRFVEFLSKFYGIKPDKFRFGLQIFSDMSPREALRFWADKLSMPTSQFMKVIVTPARSLGTYREKTKHGVLTVYVSNIKLRNLLVGEIEKLSTMRYSARVPYKPK